MRVTEKILAQHGASSLPELVERDGRLFALVAVGSHGVGLYRERREGYRRMFALRAADGKVVDWTKESPRGIVPQPAPQGRWRWLKPDEKPSY